MIEAESVFLRVKQECREAEEDLDFKRSVTDTYRHQLHKEVTRYTQCDSVDADWDAVEAARQLYAENLELLEEAEILYEKKLQELSDSQYDMEEALRQTSRKRVAEHEFLAEHDEPVSKAVKIE